MKKKKKPYLANWRIRTLRTLGSIATTCFVLLVFAYFATLLVAGPEAIDKLAFTVVSLGIVAIALVIFHDMTETALKSKEKEIGRGLLSHVEQLGGCAFVHLKNGVLFSLHGYHDLKFPKGTPVKIMQNGHFDRRVVQLRPRKSKSRV